jgi:hypothetical protein
MDNVAYDASASARQRLVARQTHLDQVIAPPNTNADDCIERSFDCSGASQLCLHRNIGLNKVKRESKRRMQHFYFKYETLYCSIHEYGCNIEHGCNICVTCKMMAEE